MGHHYCTHYRDITIVYIIGKSLFWVGILLLIIIYFYAILVFEAYSRGFQDTDNFFCDSIDQCMTTILRFGLTNDFLVCLDPDNSL